MTEKELRKLKRSDFLQLLLAQGKDASAMQLRLEATIKELALAQAENERLKATLAEKNEFIEKIKGRLETKDAMISALRQEVDDIIASRKIELERRQATKAKQGLLKKAPKSPKSNPTKRGTR